MKTQKELIIEFLNLPNESLKRAMAINEENYNPWSHLEDWIKPENEQKLNHSGEKIYLVADNADWKHGIYVTLD